MHHQGPRGLWEDSGLASGRMEALRGSDRALSPQSITLAALCRGSGRRQQKPIKERLQKSKTEPAETPPERMGGPARRGQLLDVPAGLTEGQEPEGNSQASDPIEGARVRPLRGENRGRAGSSADSERVPLCFSMQGVQVPCLLEELRSCMPCCQKAKHKSEAILVQIQQKC